MTFSATHPTPRILTSTGQRLVTTTQEIARIQRICEVSCPTLCDQGNKQSRESRFFFSPLSENRQDAEWHAPHAEVSPSSLPALSPCSNGALSQDGNHSLAVGLHHGTGQVRSLKFHTAGTEGETLAKCAPLLDAIYDASPERVSELLNNMEQNEVAEVLTTCDVQRHDRDTTNGSYTTSLIAHACLSGNVEVFDVILGAMEATIANEQLRETLTTSAAGTNETLVEVSAKGRSQALFEKVILLLDGELLETTANKRSVGSAIVRDAAVNGDADIFRAVTRILDQRLTRDQAMDAITTDGEYGCSTILTSTLYNGSSQEMAAWAELLTSALPCDTVVEACTATFSGICRFSPSRLCLEGMSILIAYGADPPQQDLIHLFRVCTRDQLKHCFLGALARADNPMIPGLTLSIALGEAVRTAQAEQKTLLSSLRNHVDEMLLEVLDRLPQAVREFPGGFRGCIELFEGCSTRVPPTCCVGPLQRVLNNGYYDNTLCAAPLVADYIAHTFVMDLPSCWPPDSDYNVPLSRKKEQQENLERADLVADGDFGKSMQGISRTPVGSDADTYDGPNRTTSSANRWWDVFCDGGLAFPAARFIVVGVISKPYSYYKVPAMRMALDFIAYLGAVLAFTVVIREEDDRHLTLLDISFLVYIADEIVSNIRAMWWDTFLDYWHDNWNWLKASTLVLLACSNFIRTMSISAAGTSVPRSFIRGLLALSAPLVYIRFLFFAQIFRRQALVIHTIALMLGELLQFGVVLFVVMMGFAMSLYALFHEASFSQIWLKLFEGILGDTSAFDLFAVGTYETLATLLLVMYLVIMAIMLLNLLVAVLSTAHDKVTENTGKESRASKVRIVRFYRRVVDHDVLPAPLNLVRLAMCLPVMVVDRHLFRGLGNVNSKRAFGGTVFSLVSGPVAIVFGSILWAVSIPSEMGRVWEALKHSERSLAFRVCRFCAIVPLHVVIAPLILVGLWLKAGWVGLWRGVAWACAQNTLRRRRQDEIGRKVGSKPNRAEQCQADNKLVHVSEMLQLAPDGRSLREIWAGLGDPLTKLSVRRDEASGPPTVQHIQILEKSLETTHKVEAGHLRASLESNDAAILARVSGLERTLEMTLGNQMNERMMELEISVNEAVETRVSNIEEKLDMLLRKLQLGGLARW